MGSVFDSQVILFLNEIAEKKYFKNVLLLLGLKNENKQYKFLKKYQELKFQVKFFRAYPNYPFYLILERRDLRNVLERENLLQEKFVFHCRGEKLSYLLTNIFLNYNLKFHIIADIRGASIEEIKEFYKKNFILKYLKLLNYYKFLRTIRKLNCISVISESLRDYLIKKFNFHKDKLQVISCIAGGNFIYDEKVKSKIRKELKVSDDDILFVFSSGGTAEWQNIESIKLLAEKGYKVLNLSKTSIYHKNIINKFVDYNMMPAYLSAADIGIIWRNKSIVNEVSSPVKFSEYLCCGLPVVSNSSVKVIEEFVDNYKIGIILESLDLVNNSVIKYLKQIDRNYISKIGCDNFSVNVIVNKYLNLYSNNCI